MSCGRRRCPQVWWLMVWANIMILHSGFELRNGKTRAMAFGQALASAPGVNLLIEDDQLGDLLTSANWDTDLLLNSHTNWTGSSWLSSACSMYLVIMQNGIVNLTLSTPAGRVIGISYNGVQNLLETKHHQKHRGYWDLVWGRKQSIDLLEGTSYNVVKQTEDQVEISFTRKWNISLGRKKGAPLNVDKRFVMLRGSPGFYTYAVLDRSTGWPDFDLKQLRVVFKLQSDRFHYMAMSDEKQRMMPMPIDRRRGRRLDYSEAVLLTRPVNPELKGEVDDKYFYSVNNIENRVYGWVSNDPSVGFWMITPTNEFRTGGPFKQDLTTHVGPNVLNMFVSLHYAGDDLALKFRKEEAWKKVFGPVHVYLNSNTEPKNKPSLLWEDAKQQMLREVAKWPYTFPHSPDFVRADQRGSVAGQILVHDRFITKNPVPGSYAYVGLAPPGAAGSWQRESKGYQFWTKSDRHGNFVIEGVIKGNYSLYGWVPGTIGDYKYDQDVVIRPGLKIDLGRLVYRPPRNGTTLWEIGIADRKASEFYVPTPIFKVNKYYYSTIDGVGSIFTDRFRQYGLWKRYRDLYPLSDLVYKVGGSNYTRDWFYAHVTRCNGRRHKKCVPTTWQIIFELRNLSRDSTYTLQLALASANYARLEIRFNSRNATPAHFTTGLIGRDNAVARHGTHGLYRLYSVNVTGNWLVKGRNTIFLEQSRASDQFREVMYDYIRFEAPGKT